MINKIFDQTLNYEELCVWASLKAVINDFLSNHRPENAELLMNDLLKAYKKMGCRMSFITSLPFPFPPLNIGTASDEQGERFRQDVKRHKKRFRGRWSAAMLGDNAY